MNKKRYWAFVLYPESAPENWQEILQSKGLPVAISPLHDMDFNANGEAKKPHYHIIMCWANPTTFNNVKKITDELSQPIPIPLEMVKGYYRYFTHADNPEKAQYSEKDIVTFNGFDTSDYNLLTSSQVKSIMIELISFIRDNPIYEYYDLINLLLTNEQYDELDVAYNHTFFFTNYIKSKRFSLDNENK